jgi:Tfp pilus assembly protein PilF
MCERRSFSVAILLCVSCLGCSSARPSFFGGEKAESNTASARESFDRELSFARLSERHGKVDAATNIYQAILEEDPENLTAHHRLAVIAAKQGQLDDAMKHFELAYAAGPPNAELLSDIGYVCFLKEDLATAEEAIRAALELEPTNKKATNNLGIVLAGKGRYEESLAQFRKVVSEAEARCSLAYCQARNGDLALAERNLHQSLDMNSNQRPAAQALIQLAEHRRQQFRNLQSYQQTQEHRPGPAGLAAASPGAETPAPTAQPDGAAPAAPLTPVPQMTAAATAKTVSQTTPPTMIPVRSVGPATALPANDLATPAAETTLAAALAPVAPSDPLPPNRPSSESVQVAVGLEVDGSVGVGDDELARYLATAPAAMAAVATALTKDAESAGPAAQGPAKLPTPDAAEPTLGEPDDEPQPVACPTLCEQEKVEAPTYAGAQPAADPEEAREDPAAQPMGVDQELATCPADRPEKQEVAQRTIMEEDSPTQLTVSEQEPDVAADPQQRSLPRRTPAIGPRRLPPVPGKSNVTFPNPENAGFSAAGVARPSSTS